MTLALTQGSLPCCEHDLVVAARVGDDRAFEALYSRYRERINSFILSRVHDHGRAEDIGQEVFMSALRRLRATEQTIAFKPWIYEIAKNACIDEFRRSRRSREVSLDADQGLTSGRHGLLSMAPTPPAAVESKLQMDDLHGAFGGLSDSQRRLLTMREFLGLSYDEIGARTGMSRQMVESTLFRARRKLTQEYDELTSGRRCEQVQRAIETGKAKSGRSFGIRERRQLSRHLAHCQPCRRVALMAGVDESLVQPRRIAAKIAALLPVPLWRWPWRGRGAAKASAVRAGSSHLAAVQSLPAAAAPVGSSVTLGQAAAVAAALAIAGAGGGIVNQLVGSGHPVRRPTLAVGQSGTAVRSSPSSTVQHRFSLGVALAGGATTPAKASNRGQAAASRRVTRFSHDRTVSGSPAAGERSSHGASKPALAPAGPSATQVGQTAGTLSRLTSSAVSGVTTLVPSVVGSLVTSSSGGSQGAAIGSIVHSTLGYPEVAGSGSGSSASSPLSRPLTP